MAKFTFTRDYLERQRGPKRHYKDWRAGETYTMTKEHATALQENRYGYTIERNERTGTSEEYEGSNEPLASRQEDPRD